MEDSRVRLAQDGLRDRGANARSAETVRSCFTLVTYGGPQMRKAIALPLLTVVLFGAACSSGSNQAESSTTEEVGTVSESESQLLEPAEFSKYMEDNPDAPVVNVHIPYEGHIEGTDSFVAFDDIADWDGLPEDLSAPLVLYCRSGNMSAQATDTLETLGYTNVVDLDGGMNAWTDAGLELGTEEPSSTE